MKDLDLFAAKTAQAIINQTKSSQATDVENLVTKALGVLQENGAYAALLYLYSRGNATEKPIAEQVREELLDLLSKSGLPSLDKKDAQKKTDARTALNFLTDKICNDLDKLLLVKQLWEQTLIYARYGAKAQEAEKKERVGEA